MAWSIGEIRSYGFTGAVQNEILPAGIYKFECWGAQGRRGYYSSGTAYGLGGKGGYCAGDKEILIPTNIEIYVGSGGDDGWGSGANMNGGWNGGGQGLARSTTYWGAGGGGASDIRIGGSDLTNRIIVAGAGGGGCASGNIIGGVGGGLTGGNTSYSTGGTQEAGGLANGGFGLGGNAPTGGSSGGGGGFYGGGGGQGSSFNYRPGAGGSSYYGTLINPTTIAGQKLGNGEIKITCLSLGGATKNRRFAQII